MLAAMRWRSLASVAAACAAWSAPALADPRDAVAAEALFRQGRDALARGDWSAACPKFAESQRLDPAVGTLMNVADCDEHEGHLARAWEEWQEAIDQLRHSGDDRVTIALARREALDARVPRLTLRLAEGASAEVTRDGVTLGRASLGVALPVDPGAHTIVVSAPGRETVTRVATLREGESVELTLAPGPATTAPPPAPSPPSRMSTPRAIGYGAIAAGAVALGVAVVSALVVVHEKSVVDASCGPDNACSPAGLDAARAGKTWVTINTVSSVIALAAGGVGVTLLLATPSSSRKTSVAPVAPPTVGLVLTGSFR